MKPHVFYLQHSLQLQCIDIAESSTSEKKCCPSLWRSDGQAWIGSHNYDVFSKVAEPASALTAREAEVLLMIASGASNKKISMTLGITPSTVSTYVKSITEKYGLKKRAQLTGVLVAPSGIVH